MQRVRKFRLSLPKLPGEGGPEGRAGRIPSLKDLFKPMMDTPNPVNSSVHASLYYDAS